MFRFDIFNYICYYITMELNEIVENGVFLSVLREKWETLGFTPLYLFKLLERGWDYDEICFVLANTVGKDFAEVKTCVWLERLKDQGVEIRDNEPVIQLLDRLMFVYLELHGYERRSE